MASKSIIIILLLATNAFAGFGGARSGGGVSARSYSAPAMRSSSFGGARAVQRAAPVTISRPVRVAPASTTVIHEHSGSDGLLTGMMMGSMLSHPAPVIVAPMGVPNGTVMYDYNNQHMVSRAIAAIIVFLITIGLIGFLLTLWVRNDKI